MKLMDCLICYPSFSHHHLSPTLIKLNFFFFRAALAAYGSSQASGRILTVAVGLHHSHNNEGSEPGLLPVPQLVATPDL